MSHKKDGVDMGRIVVDIGGSGTRIGVVSEKGVAAIQRESLDSVEGLIAAIKERADKVTGVAISVPGFVQGDSGKVLLSRNAPWLVGNLSGQLKNAFPEIPIHVVNDGEAHALALLSHSDLKLGAINLSIGTGVGFGVLDINGKVVRNASGENWDIGDMWIKTSASEPYAWWALGEHGIEELKNSAKEGAYKKFGYRLGAFLSQLAIIFRPRTIGLSGGYISRYWDAMKDAVREEFKAPTNIEPRIVAQKDAEVALVGLAELLDLSRAKEGFLL